MRRVRRAGTTKWQGAELFISEVLAREPVGLFTVAEDVWLVKYGPVVLGTIKDREGLIRIGPGRPPRPDAT